jgi:hypothetical protein
VSRVLGGKRKKGQGVFGKTAPPSFIPYLATGRGRGRAAAGASVRRRPAGLPATSASGARGKRRRATRGFDSTHSPWVEAARGADQRRRRSGGVGLRRWLGVGLQRGSGGLRWLGGAARMGAGLFIAGARSVRGGSLCAPALRRGRLRRARVASRGGDRWQVNSYQ